MYKRQLGTRLQGQLSRVDFDAQRAACLKARQDLLIHRQALGFKTNNHAVVEKYYPIESLRKIDESPDEAEGSGGP